MLDLKAIEERCNAATKGPWHRYGGTPPSVNTIASVASMRESRLYRSASGKLLGHYTGVVQPGHTSPPEHWQADWEDLLFIAHARTDVPAMVDEIVRLRVALEYVYHQGSDVLSEEQRKEVNYLLGIDKE